MQIWQTIAAVLSGLIVCVPLAIKLVQVTREAARKGNWNKLVSMVAQFMAEAEVKIEDNATRKEWVIGMVRTSAGTLDYDLTEVEWLKISDMIDALCTMARTVNGPDKTADTRSAELGVVM